MPPEAAHVQTVPKVVLHHPLGCLSALPAYLGEVSTFMALPSVNYVNAGPIKVFPRVRHASRVQQGTLQGLTLAQPRVSHVMRGGIARVSL